MFRAGVPEKLVQECTGHRTVKALRMYERPSTSQHAAVSNILLSPEEVDYNKKKPTTSVSANASALTLIFGTTSNCVINVNIGTRMTKECGFSSTVEKSCPISDI